MGTQDPFGFLDSDVSITTDDCSSSCVYSIDTDSSSVSTVQHSNTGTVRVKPSLSTNTTAERAQPSPSTPFLGVGRVNASFDLSLHPKLSQVSTPPEYNHLRTIMINACMISPGFCKKFTYESNTVFCALVDTGAWGSATCHKELIMDYTKHTSSFPCPVHLTGAITEDNGVSNSIVPLGEGFILVPSRFPQRGFVRIKIYYSPHLTGTIINEDYIIGYTKKHRDKFSGLTLHKYYGIDDDDLNTWEIQVHHRSNDSTRDILITGIKNDAGKCYTQPLLFPEDIHSNSPLATINTSIDMAMVGDDEFCKDYDATVAHQIHVFKSINFT